MRKQKMIELAEIARNGYREPQTYVVERYSNGLEVCLADVNTKAINHNWPQCKQPGDTVVIINMPAGMKPRRERVSYKAGERPENKPFYGDNRRKVY
jgi:guanylate kinase